MTLKVPCRSCGVNIEHEEWMSGSEVKCPDCQKMTLLLPLGIDKKHEAVLREAKARQTGIDAPAKDIRVVASRFGGMAIIMLVLAGAAFAFAVLAMAEDSNSDAWIPCVGICSGFLGAASWLYLIAQIIHIRANTAKE